MTKIMVTGATGGLGNQMIEFLLEKNVTASDIVALARDSSKLDEMAKQGIEVRKGDYHDPASLKQAIHDIDRGRTRISTKIYHKLIDPLHKPIEAMTTEAPSGVRNA
jgi:NADP-dependent 3-hydroxy acid dehydrogenase YdfG